MLKTLEYPKPGELVEGDTDNSVTSDFLKKGLEIEPKKRKWQIFVS
jgi:hypothetical protein